MSTAQSVGTQTASRRNYFLLRRIHSLTGIVPVGVFVIFHLIVNSTILAGAESFQFCVDQIHLLEKAGLLVPVEMITIFLPLAFHAGLGVIIVLGGTPNASVYRYGGNIRYTLQRTTGLIAFVFILFHVWQMHWLGKPFGGAYFDAHHASVTAAKAMQSWGLWSLVYAIGVIATVFHLANGIWTSLITWGITVGERSQRMTGYACTALGIVIGLVGLGAIFGFRNLDVSKAEASSPAHVAANVIEHGNADE